MANVLSIEPAAARGFFLAALSRRLYGLAGLLVPIALVAVWYLLLAVGVFQPYQLPYPQAVFATLAELARSGELLGHIAITSQRVFIGFGAGAAAGILFGVIVGLYRLADDLLDPTLQGLRSIPSLAWVPLFLLWFGIGETSKVTLIALGVFFPVYLNLADCIRRVDRKLVEVGRVYGFSRFQIARRIVLPATMPGLLTGLRGGMGLGWMFVVAAELIAASQGLGFLLSEGRVMARPDIVVGAILLFAVLGKLSDLMLQIVQRRALAWQDVATR
jgi:sulfonate transport system permease protein